MTSQQWQLAGDAATRYQTVLVPAILGPFADALVDWAALAPGSTVVDIGCGTGAATREAAMQIGTAGTVIGVDVNAGMLDVARSLPVNDGAPITWQQATVYELTRVDNSADAVLCAQTLQFLQDKPRALVEMRRILKPGGSLYVSVWCDLIENPYFDALVGTMREYVGESTAAGLGAAFTLTGIDTIERLLRDAGFVELETATAEIDLPLPPTSEFVPRHIGATPMIQGYSAASEEAQHALLDEMAARMSVYTDGAGIRVPFRSHLIRATK